MMNLAEVMCTRKLAKIDPFDRITHIGGYVTGPWKLTLADAIEKIERREWNFYVGRPGRDSVWVEVALGGGGRKYIRTTADRDVPLILLGLPNCPEPAQPCHEHN